jgi:hypothetical protein
VADRDRRRLLIVAGLIGQLALLVAGVAAADEGPPASAGQVIGITSTSATLSGTIGPVGDQPEGGDVTYSFEYGPNTRYPQRTPTEDAGPASSPVGVQATITNLRPGTRYHWRLSVTFGIHTVAKYGRVFTTGRGSLPVPQQPKPPPPGLSPVPVPVPEVTETWLSSIACPTPSRCLAVGGLRHGRRSYRTLAESWDGSAWRALPTPVQPGDAALERLACWGTRSCLAVGSGLVELWSGHRWRRAPGPDRPGVYLAALDCPGRGGCWAAGEVDGGTPQEAAVLAHWSGHAWSVRRAPRGSGVILESVSCLSSNDCWAAGTRPLNRVHQPWTAYHWNGRHWRVAKLPSSGRYVGQLAVSCQIASACWAYGHDSRAKPVAMRLVRGRWRRTPTALPPLLRPPQGPQLNRIRGEFDGLSCTSRRDCWAVGVVTIDDDVNRALVEHWNGGSWEVTSAGYPIPITPPRRAGSGYPRTQLSSIACPAARDCVAVGETTFENRRHLIVRGRALSETR